MGEKMKRYSKRAITLLEIMIVIFIIGIIGSVVGYNMKGSLDKGRCFKTEQAAHKLYEVLTYALADEIITFADIGDTEKLKIALRNSGLVQKADELIRDGWSVPFIFPSDKKALSTDVIRFTSSKYEEYCTKIGKKPNYPWEEN